MHSPSPCCPQARPWDIHQGPASQQPWGICSKTPKTPDSQILCSMDYPSLPQELISCSFIHSSSSHTPLQTLNAGPALAVPSTHPSLSCSLLSMPKQDPVEPSQTIGLGAFKKISTHCLHVCIDTFSKSVWTNVSTKLLLSFSHFVQLHPKYFQNASPAATGFKGAGSAGNRTNTSTLLMLKISH